MLRGIITDSHFVRRDRLGRLLVFLVRLLQDGRATDARAIAVDERTAALVEPGGRTSVEGEGPVYFLRATGRPEVCKAGVPLSLARVSVYRVKPGSTFDLKTWTGRNGVAYDLSVLAGIVKSTQPGGSLY